MGRAAKIAVVIFTALMMAIWARLPDHYNKLNAETQHYHFSYFIALQLLAFIFFYECSSQIFGERVVGSLISLSQVGAWCLALLSVMSLWLLSVAPWRYWLSFVAVELKSIILALFVGFLAWSLAQSTQEMWRPLSNLTFEASASLLGLIYSDTIVDPTLKNLGTRDFVVNIAPACSGYEGIGLVTVFTVFYLSVFRKEFRFPQALLLLPIGIITIWLFNALRITILIAIGSSFSEKVALGGFHSQAGWIAFIIVIVGLLIAAHKFTFFSVEQDAKRSQDRTLTLPVALLLPFIILLASTLLTSSLSAEFDWLYPLRVLATAIALLYCWKAYYLGEPKINLEPVIAGVVVFVLWIVLVPNSIEQNNIFMGNLASGSGGVVTAWLVLRFMGAVITVPLAEELLFRGYLFSRISQQKIKLVGKIPFYWPTLLVSSVLFGLMHSNLLAGIVAGLIYGVVRFRGNSVMDAVIAHAMTNLLLSLYVISTGNWSLW